MVNTIWDRIHIPVARHKAACEDPEQTANHSRFLPYSLTTEVRMLPWGRGWTLKIDELQVAHKFHAKQDGDQDQQNDEFNGGVVLVVVAICVHGQSLAVGINS